MGSHPGHFSEHTSPACYHLFLYEVFVPMLAPPLELPVWSVLVLMVATFLQVRRQESARDWEAGRAESDS